MKKKKIVILSAFYDTNMGGAEVMAKELIKRLDNKYEKILVTTRGCFRVTRKSQYEGYMVYRVGIGSKRFDKFFFPFLAPLKVMSLKPDIVHGVMESYAGGALVLLKYLYPKAKRILTLQSGDLDDNRKQKQFLIKVFWKIIHRSPHHITAISNALAERAKKLGVKKDNVSVIPNGIDFSEIVDGIERVSNRVLCMGRFTWEKGHEYLLNAWAEVIINAPEAKLVIVGEGERKKEIKNLIKKLKIESSVKLQGLIPHKEFMKEMKAAEIFVLPSLAEGLGNVFIEAQACGTVPVSTRVGGIPDVIQHEENGLLAEPKNSEQIAKALERLLSDKELREKLSKKGLETVKKFQWSIIIADFEALYDKVLG